MRYCGRSWQRVFGLAIVLCPVAWSDAAPDPVYLMLAEAAVARRGQ